MSDAEKQVRRAARAARFQPMVTAQVDSKICGCCGLSYDRLTFLALCLPTNGVGEAMGMQWRNCSCGSTLVW